MTAAQRDYAVVLNAYAKRVTPRVVTELSHIVPPQHLHVTRSLDEGREVCRELLHSGVQTVFTGGGDGTVTELVNRFLDERDQRAPEGRIPDIGILRLGTGNALAELVSSRDYRVDLKNFLGNRHRDTQVLPLVAGEGRRFPFAGLGWDAELLNDYVALKQHAHGPVLEPVVASVAGYFAALFAYTIPRRAARLINPQQRIVRVTNLGREATLVGLGGKELGTVASGALLYEGPAQCIIVGTCPFYGYGMKVLPFARPGSSRMQLRIATLSLGKLLGSLPSVWRGTYDGPGMIDALVDRVRVETSEPMPYQEAGDARGMRSSVEFSLSPHQVQLLRFI
jgi:diacylglycerol kinase family enzyme